MADDYEGLTVKQLKDEAAKRDGLTVKSNLRKADIIDKLREWDEEQQHGKGLEETTDAPDEHEHDHDHEEQPASFDGSDDREEEIVPPTKDEEKPEVTPPPAIETAPQQVSALAHPEKEPTPPDHHATIQPLEEESITQAPLLSKEVSEVEAANTTTQTQSQEAVPTSETTEHSADASYAVDPPASDISVPAAELAEDSLKRKRRSLTPAVDAKEVEAKRAKLQADNEAEDDVSFSEAPPVEDDVVVKPDTSSKEKERKVSKDMRKLFNSESAGKSTTATKNDDNEDVDETTEVSVSPARHLATRALYIANLKRPLQESALRNHIESLATPKGTTTTYDADTSPIELLYLDPVKTHALVLLATLASASRVRAGMHGRKFPPGETSRDTLLVDFVPEEKVGQWIEDEKEAGLQGGKWGVRWRVDYDEEGVATHIDSEGRTTVTPQVPKGPRTLQSGAATTSAGPASGANTTMPVEPSRDAPRTHRDTAPPTASTPTSAQPQPTSAGQSTSFRALDDLFTRTTARPSLYYKPVDPALVASRHQTLQRRTSNSYSEDSRRVQDVLWRYTFENGSALVQTGESRGGGRFARIDYDLEREYLRRREREREREDRAAGADRAGDGE